MYPRLSLIFPHRLLSITVLWALTPVIRAFECWDDWTDVY